MNKENKSYHMIAGLPRSGSTLLCNILNQNPRFRATATSGLQKVLTGVKTGWDQVIEHHVNIDFEKRKNVLKSIVDGYYKDTNQEVIFDKNRAWMSEPEMAQLALGQGAKMICCVRSYKDILASFEKLFRSQNAYFDVLDKRNLGSNFTTVEQRCDVWASNTGPVGSSKIILEELVKRNFIPIFIEFDKLTKTPETTLRYLYEELGEEYFEHDFTNVEQTTHEEDYFHGMLNLHSIKSKVEYFPSNAKNIIGEVLCDKYKGGEFWKNI